MIDLGCERVLTSGGCATALDGIDHLKALVDQADERISIMPGCGVTQNNAKLILDNTGASEIHLSAKFSHPSKMKSSGNKVAMGTSAANDNYRDITDCSVIQNIVSQLNRT